MAQKNKKKGLPEGSRLISRNKRATYDYEITERFEAGLALLGSEVKSLRAGHAVLNDTYVMFRERELFLIGCQIKEYEWSNQFNHEPLRERKLLLHARQLDKLFRSVTH